MAGLAALQLASILTTDRHRSGQDIANELGCSRAAVWKHVQALRALGIEVDAVRGRGYRLAAPLELLDSEAILKACSPATGRWLTGLEILARCGSTNSELSSRPAGSRHGLAVLAEAQSAGRGRRGRSWHSPFGRNLYLSLGWRFERGLQALSCLPLVVALAASRAVHGTGLRGQMVKWPNDLVLDGRKLGGCLVEIQGDMNGPCLAVMGVGINVFMQGEPGAVSIDQDWTDLGSLVPGISRNALAALLITELLGAIKRFEREGFTPFAAHWKSLDALYGREVAFLRGDERLTGVARGIGEHGGLLLESGTSRREYLAGEVTSC